MKKLLTMLSAATVAIGLYAAYDTTGTSFEGLSEGPLDITDTASTALSYGELLAGGSGEYYWVTNGSENVTLTVTADQDTYRDGHQSGGTTTGELRAQQFEDWSNGKYLAVKTTFGNAVKRRVVAAGGTDSAVTLDDALFFDSLVRFTVFDESPTNIAAAASDFADAKIAVWIQEEEVSGAMKTNLYVRAGTLGGDPVNYNCGEFITGASAFSQDPNAWHRLTIKAIPRIYSAGNDVPGFMVYVDNVRRGTGGSVTKGLELNKVDTKYLSAFNSGDIFPSMVQADVSIASVSFDGQGDIDDLVFTGAQPFDAAGDDAAAIAIFGSAGYPTVAALTAAIANATADDLTNTVRFTASVTEEPVMFYNANTVKIDLNGQNIAILVDVDENSGNLGAVEISDTQGSGSVGTLTAGDGSVINAGTYGANGGAVTLGANSAINGGRFDTNSVDVATLNAFTLPAGKAFAAGEGTDVGYWVLVDATYEAEVDGVSYPTIAEALTAATAGQTVKLNADVTASAVSTAAGTIDLNGKTLTLSGTTEITFTGTGAKTLKGGDLMGVYHELTITAPAGEDLTFTGMTFHASVKPHGTNAVFTAANCQFLCDIDKTGAAFTDGSSADVHSYGLLFDGQTLFTQLDVVNNTFDQGRRAAVQASVAGDLYFYGNTVVADKLTSRVDGAGTRYPALQIISNGGVFIENNSFSGQYLGEAFCVYNKGTYRTTDAPIVFSGNTVANDVNYLWGIYDVDASGAAALVNPDLYFGSNTIGANVNTTQCIYKTTIDGVDMNGVTYSHTPATLALPAGVASIYEWTHAAGAKPYYVDGVAADAITAGTVIAVPGADVTAPEGFGLTADTTLKNQWTATITGWAGYLGPAVEGAYVIDTPAELAAFKVGVAALGTSGLTFKLGADIDATDLGYFDGIGAYGTANSGLSNCTFDGAGYTISNVKFSNGKYRAFFGRVDNSTIQNLTINVADIAQHSDPTAEHGYSAFAGNLVNSTVKSCRATGTLGTTAKPTMHTCGGFAVKTDGGALFVDCTNEINMVCSLNDNPKIGGIVGLVQGSTASSVSNCWNFGNLTITANGVKAAGNGAGGLVGYAQCALTIYGGGNTGTITWSKTTTGDSANIAVKVGTIIGMQNSSTATVTGGVVAQADAAPAGAFANVTGLNFATVDGNVATFVADNALAAGNTYKVMNAAATATYQFTAAGSISFDTALATPTYNITATGNLVATPSTVGTVTTYTAALPEYTITYLNGDGTEFTNFTAGVFIKMLYTVEDTVTLPADGAINMTGVVGVEFAGWTNALGTVVAGWSAGEMTGNQTFYAKLNAVVPPTPSTHDAGDTISCESAAEAADLAAAITANPAQYVTVPDGIVDDNGAYTGLFKGTANGTSVTIEFTADAALYQATNVTATAVTQVPVATVAAAGSGVSTDAELTGLTPGVYYSVVSRSTLDANSDEAWVEGTRVMADKDGEATLSVPHKGTAGFYWIKASEAGNSNP